jgi:hypothetical protein
MRYLIALATLAAALALPATAGAGGWATIGFAPLPDDVQPGQSWKPELTILQHGVTPLDGLSPTITITGAEEDVVFTATPTGEPGKYVANVVFPSAGSWGIAIDSSFGESRLTYGPVAIATRDSLPSTGGGGGGGDFPLVPVLAALAGLVVAAAAGFGLVRQRRLRPAA